MQSSLGWSCQSLWSLIACSERGQLLAAFILVEDESGLLPFQLSCRLLEARRQLLNSGNASISQLAWRLYTGLIPIRPEESLADRRAILASCIGGSGAADLIGLLCAAVEALLESAGDTSLLELLRADAETTAEELRRHSTNNGAGLVVAACALLIVLCECDDSRWVNYSLEVLRRIIDALPKHVCALIVVPLLSIIKTPTFDASVATTTTTTAAAAGNSVKQSAELLQLITANLQGEEHGNSISPLSGIFCDRRPFPHLAQHLALLLQPIDIKQHDDVGSLYSLCHHAAGCLLLLNNAMENNIISSIDRLISSQSAINNPLECFEFLCYLLDYSERNSFGAVKDFPELKLHILVDAIPRLIRNTNRDVYLVARVLRLLLPLLDEASEPLLITLRPIALRSLAECCRNYSRLWSNLFAVFYRVIDMREIPELMELMTLKLIRFNN
jgi:hypothetical protein